MSKQTIIDRSTFEGLKESVGADFVKELLDTYFSETPQLLTKLKESLGKMDCDAFRMAAHSIKSTSNSFGALELGLLAKELEMMGREGKLTGAEGKVDELFANYEVVKRSLSELING